MQRRLSHRVFYHLPRRILHRPRRGADQQGRLHASIRAYQRSNKGVSTLPSTGSYWSLDWHLLIRVQALLRSTSGDRTHSSTVGNPSPPSLPSHHAPLQRLDGPSPQSAAATSFISRQLRRNACAAATSRFIASEEINATPRAAERIARRPAAISRESSADGS